MTEFITLVLDKNHANFQTAAEIAKLDSSEMSNSGNTDARKDEEMVRAIDAANIKVRIPKIDENDPVGFAADTLDSRIEEPEPESRVVDQPAGRHDRDQRRSGNWRRACDPQEHYGGSRSARRRSRRSTWTNRTRPSSTS